MESNAQTVIKLFEISELAAKIYAQKNLSELTDDEKKLVELLQRHNFLKTDVPAPALV